MARLPRLHVEQGIYHLELAARAGQPLFAEPLSHTRFLALLGAAQRRCQVRLLAFSLLPDRALLALQVTRLPVGRLVQGVSAPFSRWWHAQQPGAARAALFQRYRLLLLPDAAMLADLVRYIHDSPVRAGLCARPEDYCWSSHRDYLQSARSDRTSRLAALDTHTLLRTFGRTASVARAAYRAFHARPESHIDLRRFSFSGAVRTRLLDEAHLQAARLSTLAGGRGPELQRLAAQVCEQLRVPRAELLSCSRRRHLSLARALVAWRARQRGIRLSDIARYFDRDPAALLTALRRYAPLRPDLFTRPDSAQRHSGQSSQDL
jgi:putative transposase